MFTKLLFSSFPFVSDFENVRIWSQMSNFGAFLKEDGFSFEPRLVKNLENVVDFYASGQLAFPIYLWLHDLLTSARVCLSNN
jgi:hypothetical protein